MALASQVAMTDKYADVHRALCMWHTQALQREYEESPPMPMKSQAVLRQE